MGITEILTIIFVILKLLGKIDWNWLFILLPEIIAATIYIISLVLAFSMNRKVLKKVDKAFNDISKIE